MDLALGVAVGSSMQIALLVTPIMVIIGWGINVDMSLFFNMYETAVLFATVIMVNYLIMVNINYLYILFLSINNSSPSFFFSFFECRMVKVIG